MSPQLPPGAVDDQLPPGAVLDYDPLPPGATFEGTGDRPSRIALDPDPAAERKIDVSPGIPLYQTAPGPPQKELPPLTPFEALATNPVKQVGSGLMSSAAAANKLTANIAGLLDTAANKISGLTGVEKGGLFKQIEDWAREQQQQQEQQAAELAGGRKDIPSQLFRTGSSAVASLPTYGTATALLGPTGGMAALGALETADQGPVEMLKAAAQNALAGRALEVMGPASRPIRLFGAGAMTYAQLRLQGVDHETALANAMTMAGMAGMHPGGKTAMEITRDAVSPGGTLRPDISIFGNRLNPTQQAAVDYLREQGVPLTGGQQTGNRYLTAVEATTAHTPLGAQRAREFHAGTEGALRDLAGELAGDVHKEPVTPYEAGTIVGDTLNHHISELAGQANQAYEAAWEHAGDPEYTKRVQVRTDNRPVLDASGQPTGQTERVPVYGNVNMPVDVRWMKAIARDQLPRYEYLPAAERAQSAAYSILKGVLDGEDHITAQQAEEALKGLKAEVGYDTNKDLRNVAQGTAAQMVPRLQKEIDAAVRETGQDAVIGLQEGRKFHARKMDFAGIQKKLREEPVQAFGQLTQGRDSGVNYLKEVAQRAPDAMPALGRAYLDKLFDTAMSEGGWMRTDGVFRQWDNLGDQTKALLFPEPSQLRALERFFLAQKITAERINTSGTALVKEAQDAGTNILKWLKGKVAGDILFSPKGIKFLTGIAQNPPRSSAEVTKLQQQATEAFKGAKPPEEPPEGQPPTGGGTPPATPPAAPATPGLGEKIKGAVKKFWEEEEGSAKVPEWTGKTSEIKDMVKWAASRIGQGIVDPAALRKEIVDKFGAVPGKPLPGKLVRQIAGQAHDLELRNAGDWRLGMPLDDIHPLTSEKIPLGSEVEPSLAAKKTRLYSGHEQGSESRIWTPERGTAEGPLAEAKTPSQLSYIDVKPEEVDAHKTGEQAGEKGRKLMVYTPGESPQRATGLLTEDVQRYLQDMVRKRLGEIPDDAPDNVKMRRLLRYGRGEFAEQLRQPYSGVDWYGPDTTEGDRLLRQERPELADADFDTIQKAMSAAMSNNSNPQAEAFNGARIWEQAFDKWKRNPKSTLQFPELQPDGKTAWPAQGVGYQIAKLNQMIRELGVHGTAEFLRDPAVPGRNIKHFVPNAKEIRLDEHFPGSMVLGPKIGVYFSQIMNLPRSGSVVDVWMMRRLGRILGTLFNQSGKEIDAPRTEGERNLSMDLDGRLAGENNLATRDAQSVGWHYEQELYRRLGLNVKSFRRSDGIRKYLDLLGLK